MPFLSFLSAIAVAGSGPTPEAEAVPGPLAELGEFSGWFVLAASVLYVIFLQQNARRRGVLLAGLMLHAGHFVERFLRLGYLPFAEKHDNIILLGFMVAAAYAHAGRKEPGAKMSLLAIPLVILFNFVGIMTRRIDSVSPFLDSPWFYLHIVLQFVSYGLLATGFILGALYLAGDAERYEIMQYRYTIVSWIVYTMALAVGSVWFFAAYGTYWLWTAKELWATLTWFYLGMYLHLRLMPKWRGRPAAAMGALAFGFAMFTYFGVGTIILSPPTPF